MNVIKSFCIVCTLLVSLLLLLILLADCLKFGTLTEPWNAFISFESAKITRGKFRNQFSTEAELRQAQPMNWVKARMRGSMHAVYKVLHDLEDENVICKCAFTNFRQFLQILFCCSYCRQLLHDTLYSRRRQPCHFSGQEAPHHRQGDGATAPHDEPRSLGLPA